MGCGVGRATGAARALGRGASESIRGRTDALIVIIAVHASGAVFVIVAFGGAGIDRASHQKEGGQSCRGG